ncbi:hypothetical protein S83_035190 [Arachis hypogaea]
MLIEEVQRLRAEQRRKLLNPKQQEVIKALAVRSRRLPCRDSTSSLRLSGFSHSSWIREMQQASDKSIIISEILDSRTRNLVSVSRISDYVLSNEFKYIFIFRLNTLLDINIVLGTRR